MKNFWEKIKKPFFILAPMADVTDAAFRCLIAKYGKPDVMFTEFVSADGLYHTREVLKMPDGENPLMLDLIYSEEERPIVAQFFTSKPENMEYVARLARGLGFDGIDINMGCPDKSVEKQGAGASLIRDPRLAKELVAAAKVGAGNLPVSIKTRIGYAKNDLDTWLPNLLETEPATITLHARTRKEMSKVPANWDHVKEAVRIRNDLGSNTLICGNGDVLTLKGAKEKVKETGCDGVMIGKGIFGNPYFFNPDMQMDSLSVSKKLEIMLEHAEWFEKLLPHKNFAIMKKHFKAYVNGWEGAKELRMELMTANDQSEVKRILENYQK